MLKKIILILFVLLTTLPVFSMTYEEAAKNNKPVLLYISMFGCSACQQFDSFFEEEQQKFSDKYSFVKENIAFSTMAKKLKVRETPSVYIIEPSQKSAQNIKWECLRHKACFEQTLNSYKN